MEVYGAVKFAGAMMVSSAARKCPDIRFVTMSPGATNGTEVMDNLPPIKKFLVKRVFLPLMPLFNMAHDLESIKARFSPALAIHLIRTTPTKPSTALHRTSPSPAS